MTIDITSQNSAFLFIDVQEKLVGMLFKNKCAKKAEILSRLAKVLGIKCVLTEQYPQGLGSTIPQVKYSLPDSAKYFEKTDFNALAQAGVEDALSGSKNVFIFATCNGEPFFIGEDNQVYTSLESDYCPEKVADNFTVFLERCFV